MSYKFSTQLKEIISFSRDEAERLGNDYIGTEHLLLALLREGNNTALSILKSFKVDLVEMQKEIEMAIKSDKSRQRAMPLNVSAEQTIHGAVEEAKTLKSKRVEPEHLILSILNNSTTAPTILDHVRRN
ncbi:MAG TPA: Clp protease N-terminal domain-containing protein [Puia sp.]|nr:Clp protease N-terminal domain-containing protein [Puia sp.]